MSLRSTAFSAFALLSACLSFGACDAASGPGGAGEGQDKTDAIIGGTVDNGDPSVVLMKAEQSNMGWWCTGTVIAKRLVLTAAHCVEDATPGTKIRVMFGTDQSKASAADYVQVKEWHHDPQYMMNNNIAAGHDAAVLILASDALAPALPINTTAMTKAMVGKPVHVVGFGNNNGQAGTGSGLKREIHTTLAGLEQGVINVGKAGQTTCQGDSGGPSFMNINGQDVIVGITSYGEAGCVSYGSSTRVDLAANWIQPFIDQNGGNPDNPNGGSGGGDTGGTGGTGGSDPVCTPKCDGKQCGDDQCGGKCGECGAGETCSDAGQCTAPPKPGGCGETESNDDTSSANKLCAGGTMTGLIDYAADHDYFTFQVAPGQTYDLKLETTHEYVMTLSKIQNGALYEIVSSFDHIQKTTPNGGTYFVEIWGGNGDYSPSDEYSLSVALSN